jgi:hypothetical protein
MADPQADNDELGGLMPQTGDTVPQGYDWNIPDPEGDQEKQAWIQGAQNQVTPKQKAAPQEQPALGGQGGAPGGSGVQGAGWPVPLQEYVKNQYGEPAAGQEHVMTIRQGDRVKYNTFRKDANGQWSLQKITDDQGNNLGVPVRDAQGNVTGVIEKPAPGTIGKGTLQAYYDEARKAAGNPIPPGNWNQAQQAHFMQEWQNRVSSMVQMKMSHKLAYDQMVENRKQIAAKAQVQAEAKHQAELDTIKAKAEATRQKAQEQTEQQKSQLLTDKEKAVHEEYMDFVKHNAAIVQRNKTADAEHKEDELEIPKYLADQTSRHNTAVLRLKAHLGVMEELKGGKPSPVAAPKSNAPPGKPAKTPQERQADLEQFLKKQVGL